MKMLEERHMLPLLQAELRVALCLPYNPASPQTWKSGSYEFSWYYLKHAIHHAKHNTEHSQSTVTPRASIFFSHLSLTDSISLVCHSCLKFAWRQFYDQPVWRATLKASRTTIAGLNIHDMSDPCFNVESFSDCSTFVRLNAWSHLLVEMDGADLVVGIAMQQLQGAC